MWKMDTDQKSIQVVGFLTRNDCDVLRAKTDVYRRVTHRTIILPTMVCMALFMLHTLLTPLSQFACDIKSWRHKLKKHLLAAIPPFYGAGMGTDRTTVQWNIEKALKNGNFAFCSYDVTICFFFLFFIILLNHLHPHS